MLSQPFASNGAIVAFDIGVLLGFAWLDVCEPNALFLSPCYQFSTDIFRAIIYANDLRLTTPLDDLVQASDNAFGGQGKSTSMAKPSRLKSSSTFNVRIDLPSAN